MHNTLNPCRRWFLAVAVLGFCLGEAQAGLVGESLAEMGLDEQVQNAGDALYNSASSTAIGGERGAAAGRGITGALGDLALNSGKITCSLWIIQLRSHFRNLVSSAERARATGADDAEIARLDDLVAKTQDFALKLEAACSRVGWLTDPPSEDWKIVNRLKNALGLGSSPAATPETPVPPPPPAPEPFPEGWNAADVHCRNLCSGIFEAYANALAGSRNKHAEAEALRRGQLAEAARNEARAQRNLDESRQLRNNRPRNIRHDELELEKTHARTLEAQGRIERIAAEEDALAARAQELLERLKECVKGCRKQTKDMTGLDATRIDTHFTNRVREGGSAQDAQRYTTLSGVTEGRKSRVADKSGKTDMVKESPKQAIKDSAPAKGTVARPGVAVVKDGDPAVKDGAGVEPPKGAQEKTGGGITEGTFVCPPCLEINNRLADAKRLLAETRARLDKITEVMHSYTDALVKNQLSPSDMGVLNALVPEARETEQQISRDEEEVQRLRSALEKCVEACRYAGEIVVEHVTPGGGNNPFFPLNPLGGDQVTAPTCANNGHNCSAVPCTTPQPSGETQTQVCPSGQSGSIIQSRHYVCAIGSWRPVDWTTTSNTCTTAPQPGCTTPRPDSETRQQACLPGQTAGTIIQTRGYSCVDNSYSKTWMAGAWQIVSNSCCDLSARPRPAEQNIPCPTTGQTGAITQQRAYVCSNGSWVHGTNWFDTVNTCTTPQTGCPTHFGGGNYICSGSCDINSTGLAVTSGSHTLTANPLGSNSNVLFNCSGATASSQSTNLIILGAPGHACTLTATSLLSFGIACSNSGGGSCSNYCSR